MKSLKLCMLTILLAVSVFCLGWVTGAEAKPVTRYAPPDYSQNASWSVITHNPEKAFDVFFMHPTTYGDAKLGLNAPTDNPGIMKATDSATATLVSVYEKRCNVFAPRYRQVSIEVLGMPEKEADSYLAVAEADLLAAFRYYLKHLNNGRPYILAGHSQGSNVALRVLTNNPGLVRADQLVAAYLIGWTFTDDDLVKIGLPLAVTPEQTGGLITWNTIGKGGKSPTLKPGARCVNPLTWTADKTEAPASLNILAVVDYTDGTVHEMRHFTSARIDDKGGLEIPTPSIVDKLDMLMGPEVYHRYDYAFFHGNLVENVSARCDAWLKKHK